MYNIYSFFIKIIQIYIIFRPKFDDELQKMYYECLDSKITKMEMENILNDKNSFVNQVNTYNKYHYDILVILVNTRN